MLVVGTRIYDRPMRLVVWNANMAVHRKLDTVLQRLQPDVLVLSECAAESTLAAKYPGPAPWTSMSWTGKVPEPPKNPDKGLAVMTFGNYRIQATRPVEPMMEWVVLTDIAGPLPFSLIAVWAMNHRASNIKAFPQSNPQPAAALNTYWAEGSGPTILAGDFNHNVSWDPGMAHAKQHARTLDAAKRAGLASAYHHHFGEQQGDESTPTLHWRGAGAKTYHIDYAFIPDAWLPRLREVSVGSKHEWIDSGLSDHVPVVVDLADTEPTQTRAE
jgi:hypothetical protein